MIKDFLNNVYEFLRKYSLIFILILFGVVFPLVLSDFRLSLMAKYLCFSFPAVGIVLIWGYGGILSLGQGIFFGLGNYFMAMFLKLEAASLDTSASALSQFYGSSLPDFMVWNSIEVLPFWWEPFHSIAFTIFAILLIPTLVGFVLAYLFFRRRVGNVYFSIITLALASILTILIIGQQGFTGGLNGITDFKTIAGFSLDSNNVKLVMYLTTVVLLATFLGLGQLLLKSRFGSVLIAIRDQENRVRFSGYDPALFKATIFAFAAMISAVGGALFTLQVGLASPSLVGIAPSVEFVIYAAIGGRLSLFGAVYGSLLALEAKTFFSEHFVQFWSYFVGATFVIIVRFLPFGLAKLVDSIFNPEVKKIGNKK